MLATFLQENVWFDLLLWLAVYAGDYYLTIYQAGLLQRLQARAQGEPGSVGELELNPYFQADVGRQRKFSPRWLLMAALTALILFLTWWLAVASLGLPGFFWLVLGMMFLLEAPIHIRHLTNIALFHQLLRGEGSGRIETSRKASLLTSASQLAGFTLLFVFCYLLTTHLFFLGGALTCASLSANHALRGARLRARTAANSLLHH